MKLTPTEDSRALIYVAANVEFGKGRKVGKGFSLSTYSKLIYFA